MVTNIDIDEIIAQKEQLDEAVKEAQTKKKQSDKVAFDDKHYLNTRLGEKEESREIQIRLLPFTSTITNPFKPIHVHSVLMTNDKGQKVWKKFMCPIGMEKANKCAFCEKSANANKKKWETSDKNIRKQWDDVRYMYESKNFWLVRCIERGHEDEGVKFWRFPHAKDKDGIYDKIISLIQSRKARGINIVDLYEGRDILVTVSKDTKVDKNGKTRESMVYQIQDDVVATPLAPTEEEMEKYVNDPMGWEDVYSIKPYDYMAIVADGKYPVWDKNLNCYIAKEDAEKIKEEAKMQELQENLTPQSQDFSKFTVNVNATKTEQKLEEKKVERKEVVDDDLPF